MGILELGLDEFEVLHRFESDEYYKFEVIKKNEPFFCSQCMYGTPIDDSWHFKLHDTRTRTVKDERLRRKKVAIEIHQRRYNCPLCGKRFPEYLESVCPNDKVTVRLFETLGQEALKGNFKEVGDYYGVSDTTVKKAFDSLIEKKDQERILKAPKVLGIDEIYLKIEQGKRKIGCAVFTDIENHKIIEVIDSVTKKDVIETLHKMEGYEKIELVTMDMASAYRNAVKEEIPKAFAIIDHFHVIQKANMALDTIRNEIQDMLDSQIEDAQRVRELKPTLPQLTIDRKDIFAVRYLIRYGKEKLTPEQEVQLKVQLEKYPKLGYSYWLKEGLRDIYSFKKKDEAIDAYVKWSDKCREVNRTVLKIPEILGVQKMIGRMANEVFAFFDGRYTNGYAESFNNLISRIVRFGNGYRFQTLRGKILYGTDATKQAKLKDMKFHALDKTFGERFTDDENEYTPYSERIIEGFGVDFLTLLDIFEKGEFRA